MDKIRYKLDFLFAKILWFFNYDFLTNRWIQSRKNAIRLGDSYASWVLPENLIFDGAVGYLVGAGENISFDLDLASRFECQVHIFDPTPLAIDHFKSISNASYSKDPHFKLQRFDLSSVHFHEFGLWKEDTKLKFYSPQNKEHVSHSIVNLQKTSSYFIADVFSLKSIMNSLGHERLFLLKIDIEGAEYEVIKSILIDGILPDVLCVEFDEVFNPLDDNYKYRIKSIILELLKKGYKLYHLDFPGNYTFIK